MVYTPGHTIFYVPPVMLVFKPVTNGYKNARAREDKAPCISTPHHILLRWHPLRYNER